MSNLPLGENLKELFDDITNGRTEDPPVRAILVQNENGILRLIESLPAEGTDKDDFSVILGKLFAREEPSRPGYALFRLDSKSPAGLYEWINCAFRPENAKVREKMQYSITQASLLQGLSEQHFLDTVYGATVSEFAFPKQLRNARKHDYQNPQLSTKGKSAAEAAGTTAGAARRNFETLNTARPSSNASAKEPESLPEDALSAPAAKTVSVATKANKVEPTSGSASTSEDLNDDKAEGAHAEPQELTEVPSESSQPPQAPENIVQATSTASEEEAVLPSTATQGEKEMAEGIARGEGVDVSLTSDSDVKTNESQTESTTMTTQGSAALADDASRPPVVAADLAAKAEKKQEEDLSEKLAPTTAPVESSPAKTANSIPTPATANVSTSSIGVGKGAEGLSTEKERNLADLKAQESVLRNGAAAQRGSGTGGASTGFAWHADADSAMQSLQSATANVVVFRVDLSKEEVQLADEPSTVSPDQLSSALVAVQSKNKNEPSYVLYAHPDAQANDQSDVGVGLIYVCPLSCSVRQRMMYSTNMIKLCRRIDSYDGLRLVKRAESADVEDLTPDFLAEAFVQQEDDATATPATAFSRPKRPGRK